VDPRYVQWVGASCVAKITTTDELYVSCEKFKISPFISFTDHMQQMSKVVSDEMAKEGEDRSEQQLAEIEKESLKRVKRDRC